MCNTRCVSKPSLDFYRKGELPKENDWYKQYYNHSQKNLRDSYGTALNAKMKYRKQMIDLRGGGLVLRELWVLVPSSPAPTLPGLCRDPSP